MTKYVAFVAVVLGGLCDACSSSDSNEHDALLVTECSGQYSCVFTALQQSMPNNDSVETSLASSSGVCGAAELFNLYPNGSVVFDAGFKQPPGSWTGDRNTFKACFDDPKLGCVDCASLSPPPSTANAGSARCTGSAEDCHAQSSSCDGQAGCYIEISVISSAYNSCSGDATECSDIGTKDDCEGQHGCTWH